MQARRARILRVLSEERATGWGTPGHAPAVARTDAALALPAAARPPGHDLTTGGQVPSTGLAELPDWLQDWVKDHPAPAQPGPAQPAPGPGEQQAPLGVGGQVPSTGLAELLAWLQDQRGGKQALARWGWPGGLPPLPPASRAALAQAAATRDDPHLVPRVWLSWALLATAAQPQSEAQIITSHRYPSAGAASDHVLAMFDAVLIKAASTFHPGLYQRMQDWYGSQHVLTATQPDPDDDLPGWPSGDPPPDSQASDRALITWAGHREAAGDLAGGQGRLALARLGLYDLPPLPPGAHDMLATRLLGAEIPQAHLSYAMLLTHGPLDTAQAATFSGLNPGRAADGQVIIRHRRPGPRPPDHRRHHRPRHLGRRPATQRRGNHLAPRHQHRHRCHHRRIPRGGPPRTR